MVAVHPICETDHMQACNVKAAPALVTLEMHSGPNQCGFRNRQQTMPN